MKSDSLEKHLQSTYELLEKTYKGGIPEELYLQTLAALYPHMSNRALAKVVSYFENKQYELVFNDILRAVNTYDENSEEVVFIINKLKQYGYDEWVDDD